MRVHVLIPVYNDWESSDRLISEIRSGFHTQTEVDLKIFIIDDCSTEISPATEKLSEGETTLIRLNRNVGHQRAIALGLSHINEHSPCDFVVIMDGDGEDKPSDILQLLRQAGSEKGTIIFGNRQRRYEGTRFRLFYTLYKIIFRLLTAQKINFGNFCVIPFERVNNLVYVSDIWNHFSGGVIRSKIPYSSIPLDRGTRYFGSSKMNFFSLVIHGLSAIAVYTDILAVRILVSTFFLIAFSIAGIFTVSAIRFFTPFAIPGWASFVVLSFLILIFQAFLISLLLLFNVLNYRTQRHFIPALEYKNFIAHIK